MGDDLSVVSLFTISTHLAEFSELAFDIRICVGLIRECWRRGHELCVIQIIFVIGEIVMRVFC